MTPERALQLLPAFTAFAHGIPVECCLYGTEEWDRTDSPQWLTGYDYRPAPTPKMRNLRPGDIVLGQTAFRWRRAPDCLVLAVGVQVSSVLLNGRWYSFAMLNDDWTMDDGSDALAVDEEADA